MAGKKGRSGRKKKKPGTRKQSPAQRRPSQSSGKENDMSSTSRAPSPLSTDVNLNGSPENPTLPFSDANTAFNATAARLEEKYSGGDVPPGGEAAAAEPEIIPPVSQYVSPETMRQLLEVTFGGLARLHGDHWEVSSLDLDLLEPVNTAALNELFNKLSWLRESEFKACWTWALVMALFIGSRSKAGHQLIEKLMEMVTRIFSKREPAPTKPASPESPDSSPHPDTAKPS